jgi:hypothetical protein
VAALLEFNVTNSGTGGGDLNFGGSTSKVVWRFKMLSFGSWHRLIQCLKTTALLSPL